MGSPICTSDFQQANFGSSTCDLLTQLLLTNEKLYKFFKWMLGEDCKLTPEFGAELLEMFAPIGSTFWSPIDLTLDTETWVKCDGAEYDKVGIYAKLYAAVGDTWGKDP